MPGRADYWKYFIVQEMLAVCQIAGCTKPNVSLGPLSKAHKPEWDVYREMRTRSNAKVTQAKVDKKEACEMENSEVRFYDVRSSKGRLPFLQKVGQCLFLFLSIYYVYF